MSKGPGVEKNPRGQARERQGSETGASLGTRFTGPEAGV